MSGWPPPDRRGGSAEAPGLATALRGGAPRRVRRPRDADEPGRWRRLVPTRDALVDAAFAGVLVTIALVGLRTGFLGPQWMLAAGPGLLDGYLDAWSRTAPGPRLLSGTVSYLDPPGSDGYSPAELEAARPHPARPAPAPGQLVLAEDLRLFWSLSFAVDAPTWSAAGGFDEGYEGYGGEDTDFGQRAASADAALWWVGGAPAYHQWHPVSDPPVEHLADIVRNANRFRERWGWFPMHGWLDAFAARGLARPDPDDGTWRVVPPGPSAP